MNTSDLPRPHPVAQPPPPSPPIATSSTNTPTIKILEDAVAHLKTSNLKYLVSPAPITSSDPPPHTITRTQQRGMTTHTVALNIQPKTKIELLLLSALRESEAFLHQVEAHAFKLQASNILNEAYATRLKNQLAMKEAKKTKKKATKLVGDGLPRLLSADDFYKLAKQKDQEARTEAREKSRRVEARKLYDEAMAKWKMDEEARKKGAAEVKEKNAKAKEVYEKKKAQAKEKGKAFKGAKPTVVPVPKAIPKSKLKDFMEGTADGASQGAGDDDGEVFEALGEESGEEEEEEDDDDA